MKSLYDFIVKPIGKRYNNTKKVKDKNLILNTNIETYSSVNKKAIVVSTPIAYKTPVKIGDTVYVHHNVFRRFYDVRGQEKNSRSYFKDDMYFCNPTQLYMYDNKPHLDYCFVSPVKNKDTYKTSKEKIQFGILKYTNNILESKRITPGTLVTFTPDSEFEFIIEGEKLYCMKFNDIAIAHEHKGNEEEYNPSWAASC
tara:strand:+ start:8990 stop:9583 length:594 start_codon:yes stop_codon:yes gene_type:complete